MSGLITQVYKMVYDEEFTYSEFSKRMKMQKVIYLLEVMGVNVGNYSFSWYKHGPYSQELLDDSFYGTSGSDIELSEQAIAKIGRLKNYVKESQGSAYSVHFWVEDIASLHYLKYRMKISQDELLEKLKSTKSHLDNDKMNQRALYIIDEINNMVA